MDELTSETQQAIQGAKYALVQYLGADLDTLIVACDEHGTRRTEISESFRRNVEKRAERESSSFRSMSVDLTCKQMEVICIIESLHFRVNSPVGDRGGTTRGSRSVPPVLNLHHGYPLCYSGRRVDSYHKFEAPPICKKGTELFIK